MVYDAHPNGRQITILCLYMPTLSYGTLPYKDVPTQETWQPIEKVVTWEIAISKGK